MLALDTFCSSVICMKTKLCLHAITFIFLAVDQYLFTFHYMAPAPFHLSSRKTGAFYFYSMTVQATKTVRDLWSCHCNFNSFSFSLCIPSFSCSLATRSLSSPPRDAAWLLDLSRRGCQGCEGARQCIDGLCDGWVTLATGKIITLQGVRVKAKSGERKKKTTWALVQNLVAKNLQKRLLLLAPCVFLPVYLHSACLTVIVSIHSWSICMWLYMYLLILVVF